jgi:transcriptional regulator GlxA family with amidase domain
MLNWATLVAALTRRTIGSLQLDARLQKMLETIDGNLGRAWTNPELASLAGISCEHLRRLCLAELGISPMRHLTHLRMRRADALLRTGAYTVQSVARLLGYQDAFAFSTAFRRHFGIAPSRIA